MSDFKERAERVLAETFGGLHNVPIAVLLVSTDLEKRQYLALAIPCVFIVFWLVWDLVFKGGD